VKSIETHAEFHHLKNRTTVSIFVEWDDGSKKRLDMFLDYPLDLDPKKQAEILLKLHRYIEKF